jgi:hypothetical protein
VPEPLVVLDFNPEFLVLGHPGFLRVRLVSTNRTMRFILFAPNARLAGPV